ncbi:MAG: 1-(5-phosphoribosyl)-5-[(5-phosphoribosylamino)methylideneamino]imidazole-4-carboxamide isomerase [Verrucomicrobia bacterium]|nr:1-(5-phosphoribosyl)-5-[(5-phosphoribosylamino)methylideneamino]imidazole-4-carboxamide isomerase [Kiritimatiellia bacterium]MCO6400420.1 1-(5-phosphoribosyl)-5-[(5-phosphoribosylamino)methylideneamino]imidazole-4-carboxamide isomerase [Verrucomicrobiota bacterium]
MSGFTIYPAIDIRGGRCVRLLQGRADQETVYGHDPLEMARHWIAEGAEALHIIDLDGAFSGRSVQFEVMGQIIRAVNVPVQVGGGLRTDGDAAWLLGAGAARVVLGTRAWAEPDQVKKLVDRYGEKIAVGIDARGGRVQIKGWTETTDVRATDLARQAESLGVRTIISTDTATDGMLTGANTHAVEGICAAVRCDVIAAGGVGSVGDVKQLRELQRPNLAGVIVGKALYEGRASLAVLNAAGR